MVGVKPAEGPATFYAVLKEQRKKKQQGQTAAEIAEIAKKLKVQEEKDKGAHHKAVANKIEEEETTATKVTTTEGVASDGVSGINLAQAPTKQHLTFAPKEAPQINRINNNAGPFMAPFSFGALSMVAPPTPPGLTPPSQREMR